MLKKGVKGVRKCVCGSVYKRSDDVHVVGKRSVGGRVDK
jgi:hypothetical protein